MSNVTFEQKLEQILLSRIDGCTALLSLERLSGGASQETYRIKISTGAGTRLLAMRRAAGGGYPDKIPGLDGEALLMTVARQAGVPAPEVFYVLTPADDIGDGFVMEWLEGEGLGTRILRDDQYAQIRPKLARECGRIMARIHAIDLAATGLDKRLQTIAPEEFVQQTWDRYKAMDVPQPMIDYVGRWLMDHLPGRHRMTLVHNEFRNGNFMVTPEKIIGVVDWEIAHIGDPMRDLGWICTNAWRYGEALPAGGFGSYEDLFRGYEEESGLAVDPEHVRFWEVFGSFWWSVTCLGMVQAFRTGPDPSIERAAIGRRTSEGQVDCVNLLMPGPVKRLDGSRALSGLDMPGADELLTEVSAFLRDSVMSETQGRTRFLVRVAANAVDIAARETLLLPQHRQRELSALRAILQGDDGLEILRRRLCAGLRDRVHPLDDGALKACLRQTVVNQIEIDHPNYSGLKQALVSEQYK